MPNEDLVKKIKERLNSIFGAIELFMGILLILSAYLYTNTEYLEEILPSEPFRTFIPFIFIVLGSAFMISGSFLVGLES